MNREEFLEKLEGLLSGLPDSEREEALLYYNDYFDDAGPENEAAVIEKLGSPVQVAESILYEMSVDGRNGAFTEQGYESKGSSRERYMPGALFVPPAAKQKAGTHSHQEGQNRYRDGGTWEDRDGGRNSRKRDDNRENDHSRNNGRRCFKDLNTGAKIGWIALICLVIIPFGIPLIGALGALILSVMITVGMFFVIWGILGVCLGLAGVAVAVTGAMILFGAPGSGMFAIGSGLILLALGILFVVFCVWLCTRVFPMFVRVVISFCRGLFGKGGRRV